MVQYWSVGWLQANKMEDLMHWLQRGSGLKGFLSVDKRFMFFCFEQYEHDVTEKRWWQELGRHAQILLTTTSRVTDQMNRC